MQALRDFFQFLRRLFPQRDNGHFDALASRRLQHQERKSAVAGNQAPACRSASRQQRLVRMDVRIGSGIHGACRAGGLPTWLRRELQTR